MQVLVQVFTAHSGFVRPRSTRASELGSQPVNVGQLLRSGNGSIIRLQKVYGGHD